MIGNNLFIIDLPNNKVSVYNFSEDCSLKSTQNRILVNEFSCTDNVLDILEGEPQLKGALCDGKSCGFYEYETENGTVKDKVDYIKAGLYYTLIARIKQDVVAGKTTLYLTTAECSYSPVRAGTTTKSCSTEGTELEISYRPYWGLKRLDGYTFDVYFSWGGDVMCSHNGISIRNQCDAACYWY